MNLVNLIYLVVILALSAHVITKWLDYRKVAVNAKGYAKTSGMYYLLLAFMALMGTLSLSDKFFNSLLNAVLTKVGLPVLDLGQSSEYKWMIFAAFLGLVIAVVLLLKKETTKNIDSSEKVSKQLVDELQRKNKEIDALKEKLANSPSEEERLHLSNKINQLQSALDIYKQEIKTLKEQLEKYSPDNKIVKKANEILKSQGILVFVRIWSVGWQIVFQPLWLRCRVWQLGRMRVIFSVGFFCSKLFSCSIPYQYSQIQY